MKRLVACCAGFGLMAILGMSVAHATLLTPLPEGGLVPPPALVNANNGGTVVANTGVVDFQSIQNMHNGQPDFTGEYESEVIKEAGGTLDFYYQFTVNTGDVNQVDTLDWQNFATWVGYDSAINILPSADIGKGAEQDPNQVTRTPDFVQPNGINFYFNPGLPSTTPGHNNTTVTLVVQTDVTDWSPGSLTFQDNGTTDSLPAFAPGPEPASIVLFGIVLAGTGFMLRRRLAARG